MLQFNLLPDVKKKYIKAKRQKRLILLISSLATAGALVVVMLTFSFVQFAQKKSINDLTKDIEGEVKAIRSIEDLDKILTIQKQLETLPGLHQEKPESSRIFRYLTQLTPADVKIRSVTVNFEENTMQLEGNAPSLASVNRFADTLKFSKFKAVEKVSQDTGEEQQPVDSAEEMVPFTGVLTELSRNEESSTYSISFTFDPILFDNTYEVLMVIPEIVTTRSTQGKPDITNEDTNPLFEDNSGGQ